MRYPLQNLGALTSRKEVELLDSWLNNSCEKIANNPTEDKYELMEKLITIYGLAFTELYRQVSVQCIERGDLMRRIMDQYIVLINKYTIIF